MIRRWIALALVALAVLTIAPQSSRAQIPMIAQGLVHATVASVNAANSTSEFLLYQYPIPASLIASWTTNNTAFGAAPLHLRLNGLIRTAGGTGLGGNNAPLTIGVNLGGTAATLTALNGVTLPSDMGSSTSCGSGAAMGIGACYFPWTLDVTIAPIATLTSTNCGAATQNPAPCNQTIYMSARFMTVATVSQFSGYASEISFNAATLGTVNNLTSQNLNVTARWASASSANVLNMYNGALKIGF